METSRVLGACSPLDTGGGRSRVQAVRRRASRWPPISTLPLLAALLAPSPVLAQAPAAPAPSVPTSPAAPQPATQAPATPYEPHSGQPGKDVVWVPTPDSLVEAMLDLAHVTSADRLIDLGSGDGRTVIAAAKRGAPARGIEYNSEMVTLARERAAAAGVSNMTTFEEADLFQTDLSKATVITMFLLPSINLELRPTLLKLAPGTRIVSNTFTMDDWEPDERAGVQEGCTSWCTALLWIVPAQVAGTWQLGDQTLTLTQQFQMVSGTLGGTPITDGRLHGADLTFRAGDRTYAGRVSGNAIQGRTDSETWTATRR